MWMLRLRRGRPANMGGRKREGREEWDEPGVGRGRMSVILRARMRTKVERGGRWQKSETTGGLNERGLKERTGSDDRLL